ncbi:Stress response protein YhaX [Oceanobacillus oncorhynchi]|uniref:Stress response protein YhaX n=1 Tax=Oceanobacillus oncorhynchi TaxID=545501 RepID=A0A0A1MPB1_9BACI|nr:Cof-type HAD-IIB family hydrolase [Oceanobacillus oncorhynchi]CEI80906.1 Stress response protein YhaX [Oceanobacillus oncorhynchi]
MYRAVFIDIDGTMLNSKGQLEDEIIEAITKVKLKGIIVGLASGRSVEASEIYGEKFGCSLYIAYNGSLVFLNNELIHDVKIPSNVAHHLCRKTIRCAGTFIHFSYQTSLSNHPKYEEHLMPFAEKVNLPDTNCDAHRLALYTGTQYRRVIKKEVIEEFVFEEDNRLEVYPKGSKWTGIERAIEKLCILPEEVVAIGNGINDVEMLKAAGMGVAMGNASKDVKKSAEMIVKDNDNHGVARALEVIFNI